MINKDRKLNRLLIYRYTSPGHLKCSINLLKLFPTDNERKKFEGKIKEFISSDPSNEEIYDLKDDKLSYKSEQLIPSIKDQRPPLLLVFGNPATHSLKSGMFFSSKEMGRENRFWKHILRPSGILDLPFDQTKSIEDLNKQRRKFLLTLNYDSPFRIGLCVFISMPSAPGGKWGGIAGVQKLIGVRALRRLEQAETERVFVCIKEFANPKGAVVTFQKNAWNALCSDKDLSYSIDLAKSGKLRGNLRNNSDISIFGVPPTRLVGPCRQVLYDIRITS